MHKVCPLCLPPNFKDNNLEKAPENKGTHNHSWPQKPSCPLQARVLQGINNGMSVGVLQVLLSPHYPWSRWPLGDTSGSFCAAMGLLGRSEGPIWADAIWQKEGCGTHHRVAQSGGTTISRHISPRCPSSPFFGRRARLCCSSTRWTRFFPPFGQDPHDFTADLPILFEGKQEEMTYPRMGITKSGTPPGFVSAGECFPSPSPSPLAIPLAC